MSGGVQVVSRGIACDETYIIDARCEVLTIQGSIGSRANLSRSAGSSGHLTLTIQGIIEKDAKVHIKGSEVNLIVEGSVEERAEIMVEGKGFISVLGDVAAKAQLTASEIVVYGNIDAGATLTRTSGLKSDGAVAAAGGGVDSGLGKRRGGNVMHFYGPVMGGVSGSQMMAVAGALFSEEAVEGNSAATSWSQEPRATMVFNGGVSGPIVAGSICNNGPVFYGFGGGGSGSGGAAAAASDFRASAPPSENVAEDPVEEEDPVEVGLRR